MDKTSFAHYPMSLLQEIEGKLGVSENSQERPFAVALDERESRGVFSSSLQASEGNAPWNHLGNLIRIPWHGAFKDLPDYTWKSLHRRSMCSGWQQWSKEEMICTSKVIRFKMFACLSSLWAIGRPHKK